MKRTTSLICILALLLNFYCLAAAVEGNETNFQYPDVAAKNAISIDMESQRILYYKNPFDRVPIASTTKIMTAIVALENAKIDDIFTVSNNAYWTGGSRMGLKKGEKLSLYGLLCGLLLKSGNDAAVAIAEGIGGSVENFANMMNEKARKLELADTNFVTPHGLDMDGHYSSAYDLAKLTKYALSNKTFSEIVNQNSINITGRSLSNTNPLLGVYAGVDGVKTGYTALAGRCLVISAKKNDLRLITVVLNCNDNKTRVESGKKIMDYVFNNFKKYLITKKDDTVTQISVLKGKKKMVSGIVDSDVSVVLSERELQNMNVDIFVKKTVDAPVKKGAELGNIMYTFSGDESMDIPIICKQDVDKKTIMDHFIENITILIKGLF